VVRTEAAKGALARVVAMAGTAHQTATARAATMTTAGTLTVANMGNAPRAEARPHATAILVMRATVVQDVARVSAQLACLYSGPSRPDARRCCAGVDCQVPLPGAFANGYVQGGGDRYPGTDVTYTCNDGYEMTGMRKASCKTDGTYPVPACGGESPRLSRAAMCRSVT
jgi:hypothetical protein